MLIQRALCVLTTLCVIDFTCASLRAQATPRASVASRASAPQDLDQDQNRELVPTPPTLGRRVLGSLYALGPGLIVSGGGHWIIHEPQTARRLMWLKLGGLAGILGGGALLARSGASAHVTSWVTPLLLGSGAAFVSASALDLIGTWGGDVKAQRGPTHNAAPLTLGRGVNTLTLQTGTRATALTAPHALSKLRWSHQLGAYAYALSAAYGDEQSRYQTHLERALTRGRGVTLWARLGGVMHRQHQALFTLTQAELTLRARVYFGEWLGSTLNALSGEVAAGWSGGALSYDSVGAGAVGAGAVGAVGAVDAVTSILGGFTLTHHSARDRLRVSVEYDHRHDGWAGGAIIPGLASGILGSIRGAVSARLSTRWWVSADAEFGSAHLYTLSLSVSDLGRAPRGF